MTIKIQHSTSCCGQGKKTIIELPKCILRSSLTFFVDKGYSSPPSWDKLGIFYISKENKIICSGPYGSTKLSLSGNSQDLISQLITDLEIALSQQL